MNEAQVGVGVRRSGIPREQIFICRNFADARIVRLLNSDVGSLQNLPRRLRFCEGPRVYPGVSRPTGSG
jgi:hypothetical protein